MENDNRAIIRKISIRITKANKSRNIFIMLAIVLTVVLITNVFSLGSSLVDSFRMQELRFTGTTAHITLVGISEEQINKLSELKSIKHIGKQSVIASVAGIDNTENKTSSQLSLAWFDESEWKNFRTPVYDDVVGKYPQAHNEIMIPIWVLDKWELSPAIGMEISIDYIDPDSNAINKEVFTLSGYYTNYTRSNMGEGDVLLVSEQFAKSYRFSHKTEASQLAVSVLFKTSKKLIPKAQNVADTLVITDAKQLIMSPPFKYYNPSFDTFAMIVIFMVMLMGYLLIYNVLYISVSKDTRFYGLLKTIGTTPKQIMKIVLSQAAMLSAIAIPIGLIVGAALSLAVVPAIMLLTTANQTGVVVSFNISIFIGAAVFSFLTTIIGAVAPAFKASKITAVEAVRYTDAAPKSKLRGAKKVKNIKNKVRSMAWRNVFRDKKRAFIVFLSMLLGITIFMCSLMIVLSMDADNFITYNYPNSFVLNNETAKVVFRGEKLQQKFDDNFMTEIESMEGIKNLEKITVDHIWMKYDPEQFGDYIEAQKLYMSQLGFPIEYELTQPMLQNEYFHGYIIGVESINDFGVTADEEAFDKGELFFLERNEHLKPFYTFDYENIGAVDITCKSSGNKATLPISGFVSDYFLYMGGGWAPNVYTSEKYLKSLSPTATVFRLTFDVDVKYEQEALERLEILIGNDSDVSMTSQIEMREILSTGKLVMMVVGGGMSLIVALIGLLNFVNIMCTSVILRKQELAMLESIGMSKKQIRQMLSFEGLIYAVVSSVLVFTIGSAIAYGVFMLFRTEATYAIFAFPYWQLAVVIVIVFLICLNAPKIIFNAVCKKSVIERLREI